MSGITKIIKPIAHYLAITCWGVLIGNSVDLGMNVSVTYFPFAVIAAIVAVMQHSMYLEGTKG